VTTAPGPAASGASATTPAAGPAGSGPRSTATPEGADFPGPSASATTPARGGGAPDRLLRRLEWQVLRRLDGRLQGAYRTVFRGTGIDFADLRGYVPEDDVRHIDWNVTARLDEPYVRQYNEDREVTAWLVLDRSASMRFGSTSGPARSVPTREATGPRRDATRPERAGRRGRPASGASAESGTAGGGKAAVVTDLAVCLARLFTQGGNRVGAILYDNQVRRIIPARTGRTHVLHLTHELTKAGPVRDDRRPTDIAAMLHLAAANARRRGLVFVISDFIGELDWEPALTRLALRHEVVAIRIVDPAELELPDLGLVLVEDAETGEQLLADTSDPLFRRRLRAEVDAREFAVTGAIRRAGAAAHRLGTDQDLVAALVEMAQQSKRRRGAASGAGGSRPTAAKRGRA
jgi:uncharacterized protein (DUF58 family)